MDFDFNADPDPAFHSNADPDPTSNINADPDLSGFHCSFLARYSFNAGAQHHSMCGTRAGIFKKSMGARNRGGIGL